MHTLRLLAPFFVAGLATAQSAYLVDSNLDQLFSVNLSTGAATLIASTANNGLDTPADLTFRARTAELWTVDLAGGEVGTIDVVTGTFTAVYQTNMGGWQGIAWDENSEQFYLANQDDSIYVLDPSTGITSLLGNSGFDLITCLDTNRGDELFGIDFVTGAVVQINKATGVGTSLSTTASGFQGLGISAATGTWFSVNTTDDSLHSVNPTTGANAVIGSNGAGIAFAKGFDLAEVGTVVASNIEFGTACNGITLSGAARPVGGTTWRVGLSVPPTAPAALIFGLMPMNLSLTPFGAPGCSQYVENLGLAIFISPVPNPTYALAIPAAPALVGKSIRTQGFALLPGINPLNAGASNGLRALIGDI